MKVRTTVAEAECPRSDAVKCTVCGPVAFVAPEIGPLAGSSNKPIGKPVALKIADEVVPVT